MGNPEVGRENFNYLRSRWKDSTHATFGGNGHLGTVSENYMFPDSTDIFGWGMNGTPPPFSWSEAQAAILPSDIRGVGASGPFTFHPGEVVCIDYAYVFSRASSGGNLASVVKMKTDIDNIRNFYKNSPDLQACNCSNYSLGFPNQKTPSTSLVNVYPNPFSTTTTLTLQGNYHNPSLLIYNLLGQEVETQCITSLQANGNFQFTIHRNNLPAGMYFYKVMEENKEVIGLGKMVVSE